MAASLISLGSNLADRAQAISQAVQLVNKHPDLELCAQSRLWETPSVGGPQGQEDFLNCAILVYAKNSPLQLLHCLQEMESQLGRTRDVRWGPRSIDLDILLFGDRVIRESHLCIPHPRMSYRYFVLQPAVEVAPGMVHPELKMTVRELLDHLEVSAPYLAVAGPIGAGKSRLVKEVSGALPQARCLWEEVDAEILSPFYEDPTVHGWSTELQFLKRRAQVLRSLEFSQRPPQEITMSDFWFDQSAAFARFWLTPGQFREYEQQYLALRGQVPQPRLLVKLDHPVASLVERIAQRGRPFELGLEGWQLGKMRQLLEATVSSTHRGALLRLDAADQQDAASEVLAAVAAMTRQGKPAE